MTTFGRRQEPELSFRRTVLALVVIALSAVPAGADDAEIAKVLKDKGAEATESDGVVTGLTVKDGSKLADDDFHQLTRLRRLKTLDLSNGLNDERISQLIALEGLEYLQTNLAQVTDDGLKPLAKLKNLKTLKLFHPDKSFSGVGLAHLADMPNLRSMTVAGSLAFGDHGMAAAAQLTGLTEFRSWHAGYPILKDNVLFLLDWLVKNPKTGKLVSGPSASPENGFRVGESDVVINACMGPTIDQMICYQSFTDALRRRPFSGATTS